MFHTGDDLALAERHLAQGRVRIEQQRRLIRRLRARGQPTDLAEQLLNLLKETLEQMQAHRDYLTRCAADD